MAKKRLAVLGSTGSIGRQTLEVVSAFPSLFTITGLATKGYLDVFEKQISKFKPRHIVIDDKNGLIRLAEDPGTDIIVMSIVGTAGLPATIAAIKMGKTIALASKEILVAAGDIVMPLAKKYGAQILPLDSEHSAVFQCLGTRVQGPGSSKTEKIKEVDINCIRRPFQEIFKETAFKGHGKTGAGASDVEHGAEDNN